MTTVIIVIHLMVVVTMIVVVLLQKSEGGALGIGGGGGGGGFMTGRGQANLLTRATAILAGVFFMTSISLSILANMNRKPTSVFDDAAKRPGQTQPASQTGAPGSKKPATDKPSLFDQLKRTDKSTGANPGPATPAPGSPQTPPATGK